MPEVTVPQPRVAGTEVPEARVGTCLGERAAKTGVDVALVEPLISPPLKKPVLTLPAFAKPVLSAVKKPVFPARISKPVF